MRYEILVFLFIVLIVLIIVAFFTYVDESIIYSKSKSRIDKSVEIDSVVFLRSKDVQISQISPIIANDTIKQDSPNSIKQDYESIISSINSPRKSTASSSKHELASIESVNKKKSQKEVFKFKIGSRKFRSIGERLCCKILEEYMEREVMVNYRPNFLRNPKTGKNLELDVYDPISKIAIEYNGSQHYIFEKKFHHEEKDLNRQKQNDDLKHKLCKKNSITLIEVPYVVDCGRRDKEGEWKYISRTEDEREKRLRAFILPFLINYDPFDEYQ